MALARFTKSRRWPEDLIDLSRRGRQLGIWRLSYREVPTGSLWVSFTVPGTGLSFFKYLSVQGVSSPSQPQHSSISAPPPAMLNAPNPPLTPNQRIWEEISAHKTVIPRRQTFRNPLSRRALPRSSAPLPSPREARLTAAFEVIAATLPDGYAAEGRRTARADMSSRSIAMSSSGSRRCAGHASLTAT